MDEQTTPSPAPNKSTRSLWVPIVTLVTVALAVGTSYTATLREPKPLTHTEETRTDSTTPRFVLEDVSTLQTSDKQLAVTWLTEREEMPDQMLVTYANTMGTEGPSPTGTYYRIGTTAAADVIAYIEPCIEMCMSDPSPFFLLKNADDASYTFLLQHLTEGSRAYYEDTKSTTPLGGTWTSQVTFDDTLTLQDISNNEYTVNNEGRHARLVPRGGARFLPYQTTSNVENIPGLPGFVRIYDNYPPLKDYPAMRMERLYKQLPAGLVVEYYLEPGFYTQYGGTPRITWTDGTTNTSSYRIDGVASCGGHGAVSIDTARSETQLSHIGTTSTDEAVYGLPTNDPLLVGFYTASGGKQYTWDEVRKQNIEIPFTIEDFVAVHGVIIYKDMLGRYAVLSNTDYGPQAECGKPVIYLYPEHDTQVSVHVGADVTVSEPAYSRGDSSGWNALAKPNGELFVAGKLYPYLFWEGTGHGAYPSVTMGVIVPTVEAEVTLRTQLSQLGLRGREVTDFLEFWLPRMPHTPYVRLSWLGTRDMDELAPLTITPKPDTAIRVFLDFAGVEAPHPFAPQTLTSRPRTGFTVVEWGGLLRN